MLFFPSLVWFLFVVFTVLHLYANYQAVSVLSMETFNKSRLHLFVREFLLTGGKIPTPQLVNSLEPLIRGESSNHLVLECNVSLKHFEYNHTHRTLI